jgi:hypothetical protein
MVESQRSKLCDLNIMDFVDLLIASGLGFKIAVCNTVADSIYGETIPTVLHKCSANPSKCLVVVDGTYVMIFDTTANAGLPPDMKLNPHCVASIHRYSVLYHSAVSRDEHLVVSNTSRLLKRLTNDTPSLVVHTDQDRVAMVANMFSEGAATTLDSMLLCILLINVAEAVESPCNP